ncbi:Rid family hydrolase [Pseudomonas putida]|uniref:RraA family protein n=1 Tax=Pseudomonas putida TaxID=303 RepID=UPI00383B36AA
MKRIHSATGTISPVGPYSQAVISGHLVFTAGQIPSLGSLEEQPDNFKDQVRLTLRLAEPDAIAVNRALISLQPGDALVIDMAGDHAHACIGAVTQFAARCAGAAGIIVDGVVTDINELRACQLQVFARGTTQRRPH